MSHETFASALPQKPEVFSRHEKEFLNTKLQEMHDGALLEEDFGTFIDKQGVKHAGLYSAEEVEKDKEEILSIKRNFDIKNKSKELEADNYEWQQEIMETSRYVEALFYEKLGGKDGWLPGAMVYKTAEYDDFKNGIDFIVELDQEQFGVAIDVTLSRRPEVIIKKLNRVKNLIDHDKLSEAKYYERADTDESTAIPLAVIALDYDHAVQALKFWADGDDALLAKHPTRVKAWLEKSAQFDAYRTYAEHKGKSGIAEVYGRAYIVVQNIIADNQDVVDKYCDLIEKDEAYQTIIGYCNDLKQAA